MRKLNGENWWSADCPLSEGELLKIANLMWGDTGMTGLPLPRRRCLHGGGPFPAYGAEPGTHAKGAIETRRTMPAKAARVRWPAGPKVFSLRDHLDVAGG